MFNVKTLINECYPLSRAFLRFLLTTERQRAYHLIETA